MTLTPHSADKYAFLFSGPTSPRFLKDLENVAETLVDDYNYLPTQITVVLGSTPSPMPSFSGATTWTISSVSELDTRMSNFGTAANGANKTVLLYVTGGGIAPPSGTTDSRLVVTGGTTPDSVGVSWLTPRLNALSASHVNVVMQQPYAGGFESALTASTLTEWSFTYACRASEPSYGDSPVVKGSFFTHAWTRALKLEALPASTPDVGLHADELGAGTEGTNRLVSLQEAMAFAKQIHDHVDGFAGISTPGYAGPLAGGSQHLGLPAFLIRDGAPWWESPDIYLTYPNHFWIPPGDLYIPDPPPPPPPPGQFNNTINIDVRNVGTHPVRRYALGIELFKTGLGVTNAKSQECDITPAAGVMRPMDPGEIDGTADTKDTFQWNVEFQVGTTHECVKAEARHLCSELDWGWNVPTREYEAQRNTDEMTIVPLPPLPPIPHPVPPIPPNLRGYQEHIYGIKNRFRYPCRFVLVLPRQVEKLREQGIELTWFQAPDKPGPNDPEEQRKPLKVEPRPVPHIPFLLQAGEAREVIVRVKLKPEVVLKEAIRLPVEIRAQEEWPEGAKEAAPGEQPLGRPVAGVTLAIQTAQATLAGVVRGPGGRPVPKARVHLRTANGLQEAVVTTDRRGLFRLPGINPDVYLVSAAFQDRRSKTETVVLLRDRQEKVELRLGEPAPD
jgi:hypothetical protein